MALAGWQATIQNDNGDVISGGSVEVRSTASGTPLATLFDDKDGSTGISNPFTAGTDGFAQFFVTPGQYTVAVTANGSTTTWTVDLQSATDPEFSGDVAFDTDGFFFDQSTGNVGIGTASPTEILHVAPTGTTAAYFVRGGAIETIVETSNSGSVAGMSLKSPSNKWSIFNAATSRELTFEEDGTERMRIDSSGQVGIGTTSPEQSLHVSTIVNNTGLLVENAGGTPRLTLRGNSLSASQLNFGDADSDLAGQLLYNHGSDFLAIKTAGAEHFRIDASGNVGIGTTDPKLDLAFAEKVLRVNSGGTADNAIVVINGGDAPIGDVGALLAFGSQSTRRLSQVAGDINGNLRFAINGASSLTEAMRIDASGRVGIGNTSPSSYSAAASNLVVGTASGAHGITIATGSTSQGSLFFADGTGTTAEQAAGYVIYEHNSRYMAFGVENSEAMRIDSSGEVGIGTTNPQDDLHIAAGTPTIRLEDNTGTSNFGSMRYIDGRLLLESDRGNVLASSTIEFSIDASEVGRFDSSGNFLVGGTSAGAANAATLYADGEARATQFTFSNNIVSGLDTEAIYRPTTGTMAFRVNSSEAARFDSSGNLLVGTTSSLGRLVLDNASNTTLTLLVSIDSGGTAAHTHVEFQNGNGGVGSIVTSGTTTTYNTSSARWLKENIVDFDKDPLEMLAALKPRAFNWKADGRRSLGFIADEFAEVFPSSTSFDEEGRAKSIDAGTPEVTATLVAVIQKLEARVSALEAS